MVPKAPKLANGTLRSKVGKSNIKVQGWPKEHKGPMLDKGT